MLLHTGNFITIYCTYNSTSYGGSLFIPFNTFRYYLTFEFNCLLIIVVLLQNIYYVDNISYFRSVPFHPAEEWKDVKAENLMNKIFEIKENIAYSKPNNLSLSQLSVYIYGSKTVTEFLKVTYKIKLLE